MTQFVQQYAVVIGQLRYPTEDINNIEYLTATRIYKVHSRREHIPRISKLFVKQIQCLYTNQPEQQEQLQQKKCEQERQNNELLNPDDDTESEHQNSNTDTETEEEEENQNTDSETETIQDNHKHIEKQHHIENNTYNENKIKPTNMTITSKNVIEYTLEIEDNTDKQNEKNRQKKTSKLTLN